jgi:hypothetical protein
VSEVITSVEAISEGMPFPPYMSRNRLDTYKINSARFNGRYNDGKFIRIKNLNGGVDRFPIITENYFKLSTLKLQGLLLNEKPLLSSTTSEITTVLNDLVENSGFYKAFLSVYRNFSGLGTGAFYLSCGVDGPKVNSVNPEFIYKVVDAEDIETITCYVLVQPIFKVDYTKSSTVQDIEQLRVLYHYKGYYIEKVFNYSDHLIGNCISTKRVETGLTDFAVFCVDNNTPTDAVWGLSDYDNIADTVGIYEQTITLVNAIMVKNLNPILQVPTGVFTENEITGKLEAPTEGSAVEVSAEDKDTLKYIKYDLELMDVKSYLEFLLNELGVHSELSKTFLTGEYTSNLSGAAIRNLLKAPLDKISRAIDEMEPSIKALFTQILHLAGYEVSPSSITIEWRDGCADTVDDNLVNRAGEENVGNTDGGVVIE